MKKSIFLFFAAILCSMSINAAVPSKLYLDASGWGYADARYAAYFMPQNSFVDMTKVTGEVSVFEVAVPASQTKVIFVRMNGSKPANDWANKWNQTGDLTIPTDGKNKFKPSGWDGATTTWSTYTYTPPTLYIAGDFVSPNWNPAAAANKMDYADGVYSKSYNNVAAGAHQFKITNGTWDNAIGYNKNTCSGTNCEVKDNGGNIQFTPLAEGTVTITYTLADGKVHITCPEPPAAEFNITYPATQTNYTLVAGPAKAQTGAEVSFTATPAEGYVLNVTYNGNVIAGENNVYTFMMPASDVTIAITAVAATTLYYVDHNNWGNVNAYMWDNNGNNGWPGAAMTSVGTVGDKAYSYYSISFAQGAYTSIIFNNGSGSQTGDLTINTAKPYFYDGAWYTWDELLAKLVAPVVTYDYYITGSFNGNNPKKAENGMTLDGTVYKATVTLAAGDNTLKVTDGTWDKTWGANELGAAYEEVSNPNDYNNIKITLAAEKSITVIFDATAGKITFEGLTEKVVVISYVLMGVNDDWTTGIPLVRNEKNTEFEEYVLFDQEILAGDSVKVVTLVDGVATAWCGKVDDQSIELLGITFAEENGNIILAPGKYDFYYKVADDGIYIAGEVYPVEPKVITYELDGGELVVEVPTQEELLLTFKQDYLAHFNITDATDTDLNVREAGNFIYVMNSKGGDAVKFITENANWKWLADYIISVAAAIPEGTNVGYYWCANIDAFFHCKNAVAVGGVNSADFSEAGKPENWGAVYEAAHAVVLPTEPVAEDYVLPTPVKEGYTFVGWYDNAEGKGKAYTVIPAGWAGTLYAIWKQGPTTALENIAVEGKAVKAIINGQLIIIKNGVQYNAQGAILK